MPKLIKNAQIALLDMNLSKQKLGLTVDITVSDPTKVESIRQRFLFLESNNVLSENQTLSKRKFK